MFNSNANTLCNNNLFSFDSFQSMAEDYARLVLAAKTLHPKEVDDRPSSLAKFLNIPQQNLKHWEKRGLPKTRSRLRELADKVGCSIDWLELGEGDMAPGIEASVPPPQVPPSAADELLSDWEALPEGWRYYICKKTKQLREIADDLPPFLKEALRAIPDDASYWQWERQLDEFIHRKHGVVEDDGYIGPERRVSPAPPVGGAARRAVDQEVFATKGQTFPEGNKPSSRKGGAKKGGAE